MSCKHGNHVDGCDLCDELNELCREIGDCQEAYALLFKEHGKLSDENERLRVALEYIGRVYTPNGNLARDIEAALRGEGEG
jgi:hypothetical protein